MRFLNDLRCFQPAGLLKGGVLFTIGLFLGGAEMKAVGISHPNILFIAVDDLRNELGCYGTPGVHSPHIDKLASSGMLFTRAYCQQAVCNPSRVSVMTGLRPDSSLVWDLVTDFRRRLPDVVTLPQHLRKHGYQAIAYGKIFHNTFPDDVSWSEPTHKPRNTAGYSKASQDRLEAFRQAMRDDGKSDAAVRRMRGPATEVLEVEDDATHDGRITRDALGQMEDLARSGKPFFLAVGYIRPHLPFQVPRRYWELYERSEIQLATNGFLPVNFPDVAYGNRSLGGFYELRNYMDYAKAPSPLDQALSPDQQRELKHGYLASVSFIDAQVGRLMDGLKRLDLEQNTIVVLWSDHGWKLGEHQGWCKQTNFEIDTRVPLLIRAPGHIGNGSSTDALVELVDLYPTLCDLAGISIPDHAEGSSLVPILDGETERVKEAAFSQFPRLHEGRNFMGYAMRTEQHRYVEWLDQETGEIHTRELYDHARDPEENVNLAQRPEHAATLLCLGSRLWNGIPRPSFPHPALPQPASSRENLPPSRLEWITEGDIPDSRPGGEYQEITFRNQSAGAVELWWKDREGGEKSWGILKPDGRKTVRTRPGAVWLVKDENGLLLGRFQITASPRDRADAIVPPGTPFTSAPGPDAR